MIPALHQSKEAIAPAEAGLDIQESLDNLKACQVYDLWFPVLIGSVYCEIASMLGFLDELNYLVGTLKSVEVV